MSSSRTTGIFRDGTTVANLRAIVPGWEPFDNSSSLNYYLAKGTVQLNPRQQLLAFYQRDINPEEGATYALTPGNDIVRASWTRVHEQPYAFSLPGGASESVGVRTVYDVDLDGTFETEFYTPPRTNIAANQQIDPEKHMQLADEWIVGYRRSLPGQMAVDVSFVRRNWKDRPANIEVNGIYDGGVFQGYRDEDFNAFYRITNNTWNWLVYSGLEFTVTRRTKNVQLIGG